MKKEQRLAKSIFQTDQIINAAVLNRLDAVQAGIVMTIGLTADNGAQSLKVHDLNMLLVDNDEIVVRETAQNAADGFKF